MRTHQGLRYTWLLYGDGKGERKEVTENDLPERRKRGKGNENKYIIPNLLGRSMLRPFVLHQMIRPGEKGKRKKDNRTASIAVGEKEERKFRFPFTFNHRTLPRGGERNSR